MDVSTDEICLQASGEAGHLLGKFIWSLNEANHILDFSKLFSNKELVFIFISPWCFDFIYSSCDLLFVEWWRFLYPFQFKLNY